MVVYSTASVYLDSIDTVQARITAIDNIIGALLLTAADSPGTANYSEYYLDDGQTKIQTKYRSAEDVSKAIIAFERVKQYYVNKLNGRVHRLVDSKNFINRFPWQ